MYIISQFKLNNQIYSKFLRVIDKSFYQVIYSKDY